MRQNISAGDPNEDFYGYSRAVRVGNHVHVSGTTAQHPYVEGCDAYVQAKNAFDIIRQALVDCGTSMDSVVRTVTYITDMEDGALVAQAHSEEFDNIRPAATLVEVSALDDPARKVEIEVYAIISSPTS